MAGTSPFDALLGLHEIHQGRRVATIDPYPITIRMNSHCSKSSQILIVVPLLPTWLKIGFQLLLNVSFPARVRIVHAQPCGYGQPTRASKGLARVLVVSSARRICVPRWPSSLGARLGFMAGTSPFDALLAPKFITPEKGREKGGNRQLILIHDKSELLDLVASRPCDWRVGVTSRHRTGPSPF